jgi:hypothetical protein
MSAAGRPTHARALTDRSVQWPPQNCKAHNQERPRHSSSHGEDAGVCPLGCGLARLSLGPEDGDSMVLRNDGVYLQVHAASQPIRTEMARNSNITEREERDSTYEHRQGTCSGPLETEARRGTAISAMTEGQMDATLGQSTKSAPAGVRADSELKRHTAKA